MDILEIASAPSTRRSIGAVVILTLASCGSEGDGNASHDESNSPIMAQCGEEPEPEPEPEPGPGTELGTCEVGSSEPCGLVVTASGTEIELGPYGVVVEANMGQGFENAIALGDADGGLTCQLFASTFGEDPESTASLLDVEGLQFDLYTVFRPANWVEGEKIPIVTWGNGTCAQPEGYGALLRYVASHGFFVVAPNSRWVGASTEMLHGVDFAIAANEDSSSPYYGRLDPTKVAAMGHSQGGLGTSLSASDPRIKTVVLFNGGSSASKPFLTISGDMDIGNPNSSGLESAVNRAPKAAYIFYHMVPATGSLSGHLTLMTQPERVTEPTANWLKYILNNDQEAKSWFVGADCGLCGRDAEFEFGQKGL